MGLRRLTRNKVLTVLLMEKILHHRNIQLKSLNPRKFGSLGTSGGERLPPSHVLNRRTAHGTRLCLMGLWVQGVVCRDAKGLI